MTTSPRPVSRTPRAAAAARRRVAGALLAVAWTVHALATTEPAATTTTEPPATSAVAAEATATPPEPISPAQTGVRGAGIADWLPPDQLLWLDAADERFPARYRSDVTGRPRGTVLLLHDAGHHPSWPRTVAALFDELPLHGWHTLAIALPAPTTLAAVISPVPDVETAEPAEPIADPATAATDPVTPAPAATAPEPEPGPAPAPAPGPAEPEATVEPAVMATPPEPASRPDPEALTRARISAAIAHLHQASPGVAVVLAGFGDGALRAVRFSVGTTDPADIAALVLVDVPPLDAGDAAALNAQLATLGMPLLEIRQGDASLTAQQAELRRQATLRQHGRLHTQLQLPPPGNADAAAPLARRIRGWLQRWLAPSP